MSSPGSKLVLSRSTSDALLASRISLPRIGNFQCDHCGHRNYGSTVISSYDSYDSYYDHFNIGGLCNMRPMTRPHSVYTDQCNYVKFSFRNDDINPPHHHQQPQHSVKSINKLASNRRERSENHYETVPDGSHMNTMDIRIKITEDVIKENDRFSDDSTEEYKISTSNEKVFKSDIVNKARNFKKKCLARISSLTIR